MGYVVTVVGVDGGLDAGGAERGVLMGLCYRLLGSVADAEDAVQETYLRWYRLSAERRAEIESPTGWLVRTAGRICLDALGSARARRESYVGPWLPEPVPEPGRWSSHPAAAAPADPADRVTLDESVATALLLVLDAMTPAERVAFVLHDVFQYPFAEVADIVGRSPGACRQLASVARKRVRESRAAAVPSPLQAEIVAAFRTAWTTGDLAGLMSLLDPDATAVVDGGGLVSAVPRPVTGAAAVARLLLGVLARRPDLVLAQEPVNGAPGLVARANGVVLTVISLDIADDRVSAVWAVRNPDKLSAWRRPINWPN